jgi:hypothetical protein
VTNFENHNPDDAPPEDARPAFLFQCDGSDLLAVTLEKNGRNLPRKEGDGAWSLVAEFPLGVQEVMPANIDPEPILRGLRADGYFVWAEDHIEPFGTSQ